MGALMVNWLRQLHVRLKTTRAIFWPLPISTWPQKNLVEADGSLILVYILAILGI